MRRRNGYITSREVDKLGLHREWLEILVKEGKIERMARRAYITPYKWPDPYYALSLELPKIVFSHMTALYFHHLSIKAPDDEWDMTVPRSYHSFRLKEPYTVFMPRPRLTGLA
ncbi:MAG: type IV toxin-antitoxin system AbiEi family antitoxin domain-containing protein [Aeriscardovia sp.]|nr:type IV toxin-antitoxin system AbiEi family antitoxin domain-containing protein [Aeriscardovia sp.]